MSKEQKIRLRMKGCLILGSMELAFLGLRQVVGLMRIYLQDLMLLLFKVELFVVLTLGFEWMVMCRIIVKVHSCQSFKVE